MKHPTRREISVDWNLWREYVDPHAEMTQEEFDEMTVEKKIELQRQTWPDERLDEEEDGR